MKKLFLSLLLVFLASGFFILPAQACDLKLTPTNFTTVPGRVIEFSLERYQTHSNCLLPLEGTKLMISGGNLVDPGRWQKGYPDRLSFKVEFTTIGEAKLRVERNCPRGLFVVEAVGVVKPNSTAVNPYQTGTTPVTTITIPDRPSKNSPRLANPEVNSSGQSAPASKEPDQPFWQDLIFKLKGTTANLKLWVLFFLLGCLAFWLRLGQLRRPLLLTSLLVLGFYLGGCPEPVGAVFYLLTGKKDLIIIALILLTVPIGISLLWGRVFCGWICPLGAVQEFINSGGIKAEFPPPTDRVLRHLKFLVLPVFGYLTWRLGYNVFGEYEPFKVLFNFSGSWLATALLVIVLVWAILQKRPFCKYLCPLGAILTVTSRMAPWKIRVNRERCVGCGACVKEVCPMGAIARLDLVTNLPVIAGGECIACLRCKGICKQAAL